MSASKSAAPKAVESKSTEINDEQLINMLLNGSNPKPSGEGFRVFASNLAASSLKTAGTVAGAFTGAWANGVSRFKLERNYREAERQVEDRKVAEEYLARLKALAQA